MNFLNVLIFFSAASFLIYGIAYFVSTNMKNEFKRFGLEKFGPLTAILELTGALGLFIGVQNHTILILASGGLALLMLLGVCVRIKIKDSLLVSLPAFFYFVLNLYILYRTLE
ncbi:DoxX family protein [Flavobacterium sp. LB3P122]|uniref:DoxX family protein n=1 Tax=Flavobacterium algoriphilum TaxID=3398738 RepID=UPI003A84E43C